jgi:hypothetical protein
VSLPLSTLQQKLAEAHGLAIAAATATEKVEERVDDVQLRGELRDLRRDAEETRARCLRVEGVFGDEQADAMLAHANTVSERADDLAAVWFKAGTDPLAAWGFLAMGEAGEVAAWAALTELALQAGAVEVAELATWALPIQRAHLETALSGAVRLAGLTEALADRFG